MIELNFYFFLAILELIVVLLIISIVQGIFLKKYRPYYLVNTRPELFLRKYLQRLIKQTQKFGSKFQKAADKGDETAIKTRQRMTARLNWLVLERDFASTVHPDIRYWEDLNNRIKDMLAYWKQVEFIKEPPDIQVIRLGLDAGDEIDLENTDIDAAVKEQIVALKKRVQTLSSYEKMYNEMDMVYRTLESSYNELRSGINDLELEAKEAEKLRKIIKQQEANEAGLNAMLTEVEKSKDRLNQELEQLEGAYVALEQEATVTNVLRHSDNPDAKEILAILNQQENILSDLRKSFSNISMKPSQKEKLEKHASDLSKSNKEINHCMQMLELERERLAEELQQQQNAGNL